jgi:hypothetical protein
VFAHGNTESTEAKPFANGFASVSSVSSVREKYSFTLALFFLTGCAAGPEPLSVEPVVEAFRDCAYAQYAARTVPMARLAMELEKRGIQLPRGAQSATDVAPAVERFLHTQTEDYAFAIVGEGSYLVVDGVRREVQEVTLLGRRVRLPVIRYQRERVVPYSAWRRPSFIVRLWMTGDAVYARWDARPDALAFARAEYLFRETEDRERRDAQAIVALLEDSSLDSFSVLPKLLPAQSAKLVLEAIRAAGIGAGEPDASLAERAPRLAPGERRRILDAALKPGGLLDTPGARR